MSAPQYTRESVARARRLHAASGSRLTWDQLDGEARDSFVEEAAASLAVKVVRQTTSYSRTLVLQGAPVLEHQGTRFQPTAVRYSWYSTDPVPSTVDVVVRRLKKDGTPGTTTSMIAYALNGPRPGWERAPLWVQELVGTA